MASDLLPAPAPAGAPLTILGADLAPLGASPEARAAAEDLFRALAAAKSVNTKRVYAQGWATWETWAARVGVAPLPAPPAAVAAFLAAAGMPKPGRRAMAVSTLRVWLAAIGHVHAHHGHPPPGAEAVVRAALAGVSREQAARGPRSPQDSRGRPRAVEAAPLTAPRLLEALAAFQPAAARGVPVAVRDRALLLLGYVCALRRSELANLRWSQIHLDPRGALGGLLHLGVTKTDQTGKGARLPVPRSGVACPVEALEAWARLLAATGRSGLLDADAPMFPVLTPRWNDPGASELPEALSGATIDAIVRKRTVGIAGGPYSGHSLRAGLATTLAEAGKTLEQIRKPLRHKRIDTTLKYVRSRDAWEGVDVGAMGL